MNMDTNRLPRYSFIAKLNYALGIIAFFICASKYCMYSLLKSRLRETKQSSRNLSFDLVVSEPNYTLQ